MLNGGTSVNLTATGSIEVAANISKTAGGDATLTLAAGTDITIDSSVAIASTAGKLNTILDADTALGGGAIFMNSGSNITSNGGISRWEDKAARQTMPAVGDAANGQGIYLYSALLNASNGNISMNGTTGMANSNGIIIYGNNNMIETSGPGNISLTGNYSSNTGNGIFFYGAQLAQSRILAAAASP